MAVQRLLALAESEPHAVEPETIGLIGRVLAGDMHAERPQAGFLYRDAAGILAELTVKGAALATAPMAFATLGEALAVPGRPRMAAAEAMGAMPLSLPEVSPPQARETFGAAVSFAGLCAIAQADSGAGPVIAGRSRLVRTRTPGGLLVVKLLRATENPVSLAAEAAWMRRLEELAHVFDVPFHIPRPVKIDGQEVFRILDPPGATADLHPEFLAMGYLTREEYFHYPNEHEPDRPFSPQRLLENLGRNARLLGRLTAHGVIHEAVIPLFHNRAQQHRRDDHGLYDWRRMGRLDRWLGSARFPNIAHSGLRDFEHLAPIPAGKNSLYKAIGDHILGLTLVAGSAFRLKNPSLMGVDPDGRPVDARSLFDKDLFTDVLGAIFRQYYHGFTGAPHPGPDPFDLRALAGTLIDAMGVDRHMFELLRVVDQEPMSEDQFRRFVAERGLSAEEAAALVKGREDIPLPTGPHLGEFNGRISVPELLEFTACCAAACISGRFFLEKGRAGNG